MSKQICIITTGQPSTNPRVVKEADALVEAGYEVKVICAHWVQWADIKDISLLSSRRWLCSYAGGGPKKWRLLYVWTRLRHRLGRWISPLIKTELFYEWALSRVTSSLIRAAKKIRADMYIAHYPGALSAAVKAAQRWGGRVGFDAEDFHSGEELGGLDTQIAYFEGKYLPLCDYITASSSGIAEAYAKTYSIRCPVTVLNVFPLSQAPLQFLSSSPKDPLRLYWFSQTIGPKRGLEDIIQAVGILKDLEIELYLQGEWQKGYRDQLMELANSVGPCEKSIVSHPPASPDQIVRLSAQYDIGLALEQPISKNRDICLTNKLFVYLLAGNAIVATKTKGQEHILKQMGEGFSYDPGDIVSLANQLRYWYQNRQALQEARRASWDLGRHKYHWDLEKEKFLALIRGVLSEKVV